MKVGGLLQAATALSPGGNAPGSLSLGRAVGLGGGLNAVQEIVFPVPKVKPIPVIHVVAQSLNLLSYFESFAPIPSQTKRNLHHTPNVCKIHFNTILPRCPRHLPLSGLSAQTLQELVIYPMSHA